MYRYRINVATPTAFGRLEHRFRIVFDSGTTLEHAQTVARELARAYPDGEVTLTSQREPGWHSETF